MALNPQTPGVYIQEISTLPPSVAPVATGIPVFIGYTEKGPLTPLRISSLLDYTQAFGGPQNEPFTITVSDPTPPSTLPNIADTTVAANVSKYNLFYHLQMYFGNGGGPCWIISAGNYSTSGTSPVTGALSNALDLAEQIDEPTILCIPEATSGSVVQATLDNNMLTQCAKLQDRFAIMDVKELGTSIVNDATSFRSNDVGANNLKYGAAYYPSIQTTLSRSYLNDSVIITDSRTSGALYNTAPNNTLFTIFNGVSAWGGITIVSATAVQTKSFTINTTTITAVAATPANENQFQSITSTSVSASNLANAINHHSVLSTTVFATVLGATVTIRAVNSGTDGNAFPFTTTAVGAEATLANNAGNKLNGGVNNSIDMTLFNRINALLTNNYLLSLYPSATIAAVYSSVDRERGVWKAPANVSLNLVSGVGETITDDDQSGLNVDPTAGKSINAIRSFLGRGILVWGARTLDGNSNEWRYVNVRRLFIFVEESSKKASEFVVFEPNDKNTWLRVKGTISNFLTDLWRNGALAGDKPEQAFFVKVGLNETMTAQDILEGKMIVQIGMAAVRPAEFIILEFMHKLQEA